MKHKFFLLWLAGIIGGVAVLPYAFTLQHDIIEKAGQPLAILILASIAQTGVLLAIAIYFGLKLSQRLQLPILTWFDPNTSIKEKLPGFILLTVSTGILTAILITIGDKIFGQYVPELTGVNSQIAIWKTLLAAFYGGIVEEILMRLFVVSLLAWLIAKIFRVTEAIKNSWLMWTAIILASVLFGIGHLPITSSITEITPIVVFRAIALNGIGGLVFGWLYWKKGLEYAMVAHFTADVFLFFVLPMILK